jgi:hypothetical protein
MNRRPPLKVVLGQPSWTIASRDVRLSVTRAGGHIGPIVFDRGGRKIRPYSIAPWHNERLARNLPQVIRALRGDFFCMPFGGNASSLHGEQYPVHGETANRNWRLTGFERRGDKIELRLRMRTQIRAGQVDRLIRLVDGQNNVYCQHLIDISGPMNFAHHAMIKFPAIQKSGLVSTSPHIFGQVFPEPVERPENRGYSILKPGATFDSLTRVPTTTGDLADLTAFPDRLGYEDVAQILNDPTAELAWSAVSFPAQQFVWFTLKDPRVLTGTVFWISNGGRHYPPWNGRHVGVLGIEEATSYFFYGLKESVMPNPFNKRGVKTAFEFQAGRPLSVNVISGIALTPRGFDRVENIEPRGSGVRLTAASGKHVEVPVSLEFLNSSGPA